MFSNSSMLRSEYLIGLICEIIYDLSGVSVSIEDSAISFLELGFDSLFLTQATQELQKKFGVKVTFRDLLGSAGSPRELAAMLDNRLPADKFNPANTNTPIEQSTIVQQPKAAAQTRPSNLAVQQSQTVLSDFDDQPGVLPPLGTVPSSVENLIAQQLQIMQQQLSVLSRYGAALSPVYQTIDDPTPDQPVLDIVREEPETTTAEPNGRAHGPFQPISRAETPGFSIQQVAHIESLIQRCIAKTPKSKSYTAEHREHLADPRVVAGFKQLWKEMVYPIVAESSKGSKIRDIDGNDYIDVTMGFGVNLFGHNPDFIKAALLHQLENGVEIGPQSPLAGSVAKLVCQMTGMDRATFCNTGSEAVMAAVRVARTVTGRNKVVYFTGDYHGTHDEVLLRAANIAGRQKSIPIAPGIPQSAAEQTIILKYGDDESLKVISELGD